MARQDKAATATHLDNFRGPYQKVQRGAGRLGKAGSGMVYVDIYLISR